MTSVRAFLYLCPCSLPFPLSPLPMFLRFLIPCLVLQVSVKGVGGQRIVSHTTLLVDPLSLYIQIAGVEKERSFPFPAIVHLGWVLDPGFCGVWVVLYGIRVLVLVVRGLTSFPPAQFWLGVEMSGHILDCDGSLPGALGMPPLLVRDPLILPVTLVVA